MTRGKIEEIGPQAGKFERDRRQSRWPRYGPGLPMTALHALGTRAPADTRRHPRSGGVVVKAEPPAEGLVPVFPPRSIGAKVRRTPPTRSRAGIEREKLLSPIFCRKSMVSVAIHIVVFQNFLNVVHIEHARHAEVCSFGIERILARIPAP